MLTLRGKWQHHSDQKWSGRSWRSLLRTHGTSCPRNRQRSQTWKKTSWAWKVKVFWILSEFYRLSTVATKLFGFILIFCEKSSPKCLLACCPVLLVTTAKTGSIERGRFTELGPWSAYEGDWVGAEHRGRITFGTQLLFSTKQNHGFHWKLWQKWRISGFSAKLDFADFCRFCYLFGIKFGPFVKVWE